MSKAAERVQRALDRGAQRARDRVLEELVLYDEESGERFATSAEVIRDSIRRSTRGQERATARRAARVLERTFAGEVAHIERAVSRSGGVGRRAGHEAQSIIAEAMRVEPLELDDIPAPRAPKLSPLIRERAREVGEEMRTVLERHLRAGSSVAETAEELMRADTARVHLPRYVQELRDAVKVGDAYALRRATRRAASQVNRLGAVAPENGLRPYAEQLIQDAQRANAEDIDRVVDYFVERKARYQARMIARTELARAQTEAYVASSVASGFELFKWHTSGSHPRTDICDMYAEANIDGVGPGVYHKDHLPMLPAHPHCLCHLSAYFDETGADMVASARRARGIDTARDRRVLREAGLERADERGSFADWMSEQPPERQRQIMGKGASALFRRGSRAFRERAVHPESGAIAPLRDLLNRPLPPPTPPRLPPSAPLALLRGVTATPTRSLDTHRKAFRGVSPQEATMIATGKRPPVAGARAWPPITLEDERRFRQERGRRGGVVIADGNHRIAAAKEAGATAILARVRTYDEHGNVVEDVVREVSLSGVRVRPRR